MRLLSVLYTLNLRHLVATEKPAMGVNPAGQHRDDGTYTSDDADGDVIQFLQLPLRPMFYDDIYRTEVKIVALSLVKS